MWLCQPRHCPSLLPLLLWLFVRENWLTLVDCQFASIGFSVYTCFADSRDLFTSDNSTASSKDTEECESANCARSHRRNHRCRIHCHMNCHTNFRCHTNCRRSLACRTSLDFRRSRCYRRNCLNCRTSRRSMGYTVRSEERLLRLICPWTLRLLVEFQRATISLDENFFLFLTC